jgi:uncharacterized protein
MLVGNQSDAIAFLKDLLTSRGAEVELISTHASLIFLAGDRAFKLKRAVHYPYLDFSTPEKRFASCQAEVELNRRTAPHLYLGVWTITCEHDGSLILRGTGPLVDAVVEMRRFEQDALFDTMARNGTLSPQLMTELARQIARLHQGAAVSFTHGGSAGIAAVLGNNDRGLRDTALVSPEAAGDFADLFRQALGRHAERLEQRRIAGKARRCHGDLILRNICLIDGVPTLFDCLEFNEALATLDVLYDLAYLLMDLWHRDQREFANLVYNRYLDECDEADGLALIPFFMAIRAAVRAHVTAAQADDAPPGSQEPLRTEAGAYFDLALDLLRSADPMSPRRSMPLSGGKLQTFSGRALLSLPMLFSTELPSVRPSKPLPRPPVFRSAASGSMHRKQPFCAGSRRAETIRRMQRLKYSRPRSDEAPAR